MKVQIKEYNADELNIALEDMSSKALDVVTSLQENGWMAYLVGGCVRDAILGIRPKDFDVATDARPEVIVRLFKGARIIGRRFKIVHVRRGREIIEVTTFRSAPDANNKLTMHRHAGDNTYGSIKEDVVRRDFTANALYYDPVKGIVLDYLGGIEDIQAQHLRLIGDTKIRFSEDAVRMLRMLRFKSKLGFDIDPDVFQDIEKYAYLIDAIPRARLFDEVFKFFHTGYGVTAWNVLKNSAFLDILMPMTYDHLQGHFADRVEKLIQLTLKNTDDRVKIGKPVIPAFFLSVILWHELIERINDVPSQKVDARRIYQLGEAIFKAQSDTILIPKRVSSQVIEIWAMQGALERRRPRTIISLLKQRRFRAAYDFLCLRAKIGEVDSKLANWWTDIQELGPQEQLSLIDRLASSSTHRRKRKSFNKRKTKVKTNNRQT